MLLLLASVLGVARSDEAVTLLQAPTDDSEDELSKIVARSEADHSMASILDDTRFMCWEGPIVAAGSCAAHSRGSPLVNLHAHEGTQSGVTCASRGFSKRVARVDSCRAALSTWVSPLVTERDMRRFRAHNFGLITAYAFERNISWSEALMWADCATCGASRPADGGDGPRWWGVDIDVDDMGCKGDNWNDFGYRALRRGYGEHDVPASFVVDDGSACFEGTMTYMINTLSRALQTPHRSLLSKVSVTQQTCAERGYETVRDVVDECWPSASKFMRTATNDDDIGTYINDEIRFFGKGGSPQADLASCFSCQAGGANQDRGMLYTWDGGGAAPPDADAAYQEKHRYNHEYCRKIGQEACAKGELLGQELCRSL